MSRQSQRTNLILLAVLAVLGAAAAFKTFFSKSSFDTGETVAASESLFAGFKKDQITALVIDGPEDKRVEMQKDGDHWNLVNDGNFRADKGDVDKVLNGIEKLKRGKVASSRSDNLADFNLQKGKAIEVTAWGAGGKASAPVAAFSIGKAGDDWKFAFVRLSGGSDAAIRKVEGSTSDFDQGYDNTWRDKLIFDYGDAAKIEEVTITGAKGPVTLMRQKEMGPKDPKPEGGDPAAAGGDTPPKGEHADPAKPEQEVKETYWQLTAPTSGRAKKWNGDNIASSLAKLECASFFTGTEKPSELGLDPPAFVASVRREGEKEPKAVLWVGNKGKDGKYPVKKPDDPTIWWIDGWKAEYMTKSGDELLDAPPPKPEEKKPEEKSDAKPDAAAPADGKKPDEAPKGDATAAPAKADGGDAKPADAPKPTDGAKPEGGTKPDDGAKPEGSTKPDGGGR